mmetsp:Transcript_57554/g.140564  ORF Transcript_57554/g.140564 Transcript_57554/m.140564 type:complete len:219 (+) Transcript_57554:2301-2957(+)
MHLGQLLHGNDGRSTDLLCYLHDRLGLHLDRLGGDLITPALDLCLLFRRQRLTNRIPDRCAFGDFSVCTEKLATTRSDVLQCSLVVISSLDHLPDLHTVGLILLQQPDQFTTLRNAGLFGDLLGIPQPLCDVSLVLREVRWNFSLFLDLLLLRSNFRIFDRVGRCFHCFRRGRVIVLFVLGRSGWGLDALKEFGFRCNAWIFCRDFGTVILLLFLRVG